MPETVAAPPSLLRATPAPAAASPTGAGTPPSLARPFGDDGLTFGDLLDAINPLQHIPVVGTLYRAITGDRIDPASRLAGGTLFGGPIGLAVAAVNTVVETVTGKDVGDQVVALFSASEANGDGPAEVVIGADGEVDTLSREPDLPGGMVAAREPAPAATALPPGAREVAGLPWRAEAAAEAGPDAPKSATAEDAPAAVGAALPAPAPAAWFTEAMLSALDKYREAARLGELPAPRPEPADLRR